MQEVDWSNDLVPWYAGVGVGALCGLKFARSHGCGGSARTGSSKPTTTGDAVIRKCLGMLMNPNSIKKPQFKPFHEDKNQFAAFRIDEGHIDNTHIVKNKMPKLERRERSIVLNKSALKSTRPF